MAHTLLLADDSVTIQRVVELTFAGEDIRIVAVGNGQQAIDRLADDPPDIVLADVGMPLLDGYAVASFIRNHDVLRGVPVLLMVGAFDPIDDERVQASGAAGVLVKPFEPTLVISRVKELLGLGGRADAAATRILTPGMAAVTIEDAAPAAADLSPFEAEPPAPPSALEAMAAFPPPIDAPPESPESTSARPETLPDTAIDDLWAEAAFGAPAGATFASAHPSASVADAFTALLAAEQGEIVAPSDAMGLEPDQMSALVDELTMRVAEQIGTEAVRERVDRIVRDVAERLVREEIARIRAATAAR
jgi:CheY-like chemotaxis protein